MQKSMIKEIKLIELIEQFNKKRLYLYKAFNTLCTHQKELLTFFGGSLHIKKLDYNKITDFILFLKHKGNSPATINAKLCMLSTILNFAIDTNSLLNKPKIPFLKLQRNERTAISRNELARIMYYCRQNNLKELLQAVRLCIYTGARINNVLNIKKEDFKNNYIYFKINKSKRPYAVPLNKKMQRLQKIFMPFTLNYQAIYYQFKQMKKILNLRNEITIHSLRHTFATNLLNKDVAITTIQALLNHKNLSTTQLYTHLENKTLENAVALL